MGTTFALAYADYAVFLSAIAMIILGTHAFSLRYSGRRDRAWGWLGAVAILLSLAHLPEVLVVAGVAENPSLVVWPGLLVIVWVCLLQFIASGRGFMTGLTSKRAFVPALGLAGALLVLGLAPFGLASEAGAVLVSLALLGVPDVLRHLPDASVRTPARAKRGVLWLTVFALTYAPGVILVQTGEIRTASYLLSIRAVAGLLLALDFGGYAERMIRSGIPSEARGPQGLARVVIGFLLVGSLVVGFEIVRLAGHLGVDSILGRLESNAAVSAGAVDGEEVAILRGSLLDLGTPAFEIVESSLSRVVAAEPSVSSAYLMREIDGEVIILAEGDSPDHNPDLPGTLHIEAGPGLTTALTNFESFNEGPRDDQWGEWYSSYAPIFDSATGERVALLGLDMDVEIVDAARAESRLGGLAMALGISVLIHGFYTVLLMTRGVSSRIADSERRFRRVFDYAPEAILVLDANTLHIVDANPYAESFLGYELGLLSSLKIDDICVHEGSAMPLRELVAVSSEHILDREAVFVTADGRRIDVEATGVSFDYEGCDAVMLFVRDASQRRVAEQSLNFQAEFNALITDISRSFMNLSAEDIDEQITRALHRIGVFANVDRAYVFAFEDADHMSNTHEWRDEGIPGRMTTFRRARTSTYPTLTARLLGGRDVYVPDVRMASDLSGKERAGLGAAGVRSLLVVPMTVSGFTVGFMGFDSIRDSKEWSADTISLLRIVADIVATAQARTRAEAELQKLSRAIEQSPVAVIITDADGAIEYVNPKFTQLTGYDSDEAVGQNPRILKSGLTSGGVYEDLWNTVLDGKEWSGQFINVRKDREQYWASATISAMRREDGTITHFVGVQEDVTEQRKAEDALEQARRQAESANRAKSEFLATMSHEIRTPMNAIIGMAELLQDTELSIQQSRYVEIFQRAGESLLELINSVLDLSKIEADKLDLEHAPFDVRELAETTGSVVGVRANERGVELLYRVKPDVPTMLVGDSARLASGAYEPARQRHQVHRGRSGPSHHLSRSGPPGQRRSAVQRRRHRHRHRARQAVEHLRELHAGGLVNYAQVRRHRTRPDDLEAHRRAYGRAHVGRERRGRGHDVPVLGTVRGCRWRLVRDDQRSRNGAVGATHARGG